MISLGMGLIWENEALRILKPLDFWGTNEAQVVQGMTPHRS
jgi:hypothetical protein